MYVLTSVCRVWSGLAPFLYIFYIHLTVNNVHVLVLLFCDNIGQYQAMADSAPNLSHSQIILIQPHHPFQPEPVQFIHATASVENVRDSSIPSSTICP